MSTEISIETPKAPARSRLKLSKKKVLRSMLVVALYLLLLVGLSSVATVQPLSLMEPWHLPIGFAMGVLLVYGFRYIPLVFAGQAIASLLAGPGTRRGASCPSRRNREHRHLRACRVCNQPLDQGKQDRSDERLAPPRLPFDGTGHGDHCIRRKRIESVVPGSPPGVRSLERFHRGNDRECYRHPAGDAGRICC